MKSSSVLPLLAAALLGIGAFTQWNRANKLEAELSALRADHQKLRDEAAARDKTMTERLKRESQRRAGEANELLQLRSEVTRLRNSTNAVDELQKQNLQLQAAADAARRQLEQAAKEAKPETPADRFPRDSWSFAGYSTPQAALVSAIWAMREGKPDVYLNSLAGDEQVRMAKIWQEKTEADIIAKHQSDVSKITGLRILDQQVISANEMNLTVYSEGPGRVDTAHMIMTSDGWKFAGFVRPAKK